MSIDITEMVRMARSPRRQLWEVNEANPFEVILPPEGETGDLACIHHVCTVNRGMPESVTFIANAPRAILALSERVATLEAQNAALQARVGLHKQLYNAVKMVIHRFQRTGLFIHIYHAMDEIEYAEAQALPDESPTAAESEM